MPDSASPAGNSARPPLTDSPWFWVELFSLAALVGVLLIAPKYQVREAKLETRALAKQAAHERTQRDGIAELDEDLPSSIPTDPRQSNLRIPLWTLAGLLVCIHLGARFARNWSNVARRNAANQRSDG
jgi:hypothetical protein